MRTRDKVHVFILKRFATEIFAEYSLTFKLL